MTGNIRFGQKLKISIAAILLFILGIGFTLGVLILVSWSIWLLLGVIAAVGVIALPLAWLVNKIFFLHPPDAKRLFFSSAWLILVFMITTLLTFPYFYLAVKSETDPLVLPHAVLSDGNKTVTFQGMVHVGSENFYKSVIYDLEEALDQGYKLYYEGVSPSTDEANKWFADTFSGGASLSDNYRQLAEVCGVKYQLDYFTLLVHDSQSHPERHATVDVTTSELKNEYERLLRQDPEFAAAVKKEHERKAKDKGISDATARKIFTYIQQANDSQKNMLGTLCRGFFVYALRTGPDKKPQTFDPLLLAFRNHHLAQQIEAEPGKKIYITYGAAHLPGLIESLRKINPKWEVKSIKWIRGMAAPEHLEGQL
ncbi:MAG TPA: hypothetical protein VLC79_05815 [Cellvibrio sp.]|nr:hypothetical protein [Cellvibrio sp.]